MIENDTIAAVASGVGGAVTLIRVSGGEAIAAGDRIFRGVRGRRLADARGFTILYGTIRDGETVVDEVLVSVFRAPHSYTGEDMIRSFVPCVGVYSARSHAVAGRVRSTDGPTRRIYAAGIPGR